MTDKIGVLIVDDNVQLAKMLDQSLTGEGYDCSVANNAMEALELCEKRHFDIVITDVKMPGEDGLSLTRDIKMKYNTDVIVISGHIEREDFSSIIDMGASDFIEKPLNLKELKIRIERVIRERKSLEELEQHRKNLKNEVRERTIELTKANQQLKLHLEERKQAEVKLQKHSEELKTMVNLMAGREIRMAELKKGIEKLRSQLKKAGIKPIIDDQLEVGKD